MTGVPLGGLELGDYLRECADVRVEEMLGLVEASLVVKPLGLHCEAGDFQGLLEEFDAVLGLADGLLPQAFYLLGE